MVMRCAATATTAVTTAWRPPSSAGKKSLALDLKDPLGREAARRLIERCDVLLENFRPGVMARFGFDYEKVRAIRPTVERFLWESYSSRNSKRSRASWSASDGLRDPRFLTPDLRRLNAQAMQAELQTTLQHWTAEAIEQRLSVAGVPCGMIRDVTEAISLPRLDERRLTSRLHVKGLPDREDVDIVNAGFLFGNDPPGVRQPPPRLGEHSKEILESLGFSVTEVETLLSSGHA
jgi:crotonobetainyl-CoA:carnitine CoA-transferase CaiB-like acyl-CoA transferase